MDINMHAVLNGFDLDLTGFDCAGEMDRDAPPRCPFRPGCGKAPGPECPLMQRLACISSPPRRWQ